MRFNKKNTTTKITNRAGGESYKQSPELELVSLLLTSFVKDKFYEKADDQIDRLLNVADSIKDKKFLAQAGIYARTEFGMRSITHILAAYLMNSVKGVEWMKRGLAAIMFRPDDMLETLAFYGERFGGAVPNCFKKAVDLSLRKFDAYQLAKYRGDGKSVKMVDLFNLCHPKAINAEMRQVYKDLMEGKLKNTQTWEAKISESGKEDNKEEAKKQAWRDMVLEGKMGYFALLRNLRNILDELGDDLLVMNVVKDQLINEKAIKKSLVLPFRFITAIQAIGHNSSAGKIMGAIDEAIEISLNNVPKLSGKTLVALDMSGSMSGMPMAIGSLFASALFKSNPDNVEILTFDDRSEYRSFSYKSSLSDIADGLSKTRGGTDFGQIFSGANKAYDRIIVLSDMQGWLEGGSWGRNTMVSSYNNYKKSYNCDPILYSFDLQGHGDMKFPENKVYCIAGWSEKVFDIIKLLEEDRNALVNRIKEVKF